MSIYESIFHSLQLLINWSQNSLAQLLPANTDTWQGAFLRYLWEKLGQLEVLLAKFLSFFLVFLFIWLLYRILKRLIVALIGPFFKDFFAKFSDLSQSGEEEDLNSFLDKLSRMLATLCVYLPVGLFFPKEASFSVDLSTAWESLIIWQAVSALSYLLSIVYYLSALKNLQATIPIRGILKSASTIIYFLGMILVFLHLAHLNLSGFLAGMGALSAVLLLVFQDTLLNLTATFKIYNNHMLKVGDWIEVPSLNCNGLVREVNLGLIKVENFDMSVSSFSPRNLLANSFKNWSNIQEKGARLSQQSMLISLSSLRLLGEKDFAVLSESDSLKEFWNVQGKALLQENQGLLNIQLFREYLLYYLKKHPGVHSQMTVNVYNQKVGTSNLTLEISFYSRKTQRQAFEDLRAQILEHAYRTAPLFSLSTYLDLSLKEANGETS